MGTVPRAAFVLVLAVVAAGILVAQDKNAHRVHEQTTFTEDGPLQHPVPVSADVVKVLMETEEAKEGLAFANDSERSNAAQLFRAGEVHLNMSDEVGLVVIGVGAMSGADNGWFWVVRSARKNPQVVLFAGGNSLELMGSMMQGYCDIRSLFSTPSETNDRIYRFDGRHYQLWKQKSTQNPN
jgi:hypothetical protein